MRLTPSLDLETADGTRGKPMIEEIPEWQQRLEAAVAKNVQQRTVRSKERAEMARRRAYGLAQRHAAKLARCRNCKHESCICPSLEEVPYGQMPGEPGIVA